MESWDFGAICGVVELSLGLVLPFPLYIVNSLDEDEDTSRVEILVSSLVRHLQNYYNLGIVNLSPITSFVEGNVEENTWNGLFNFDKIK